MRLGVYPCKLTPEPRRRGIRRAGRLRAPPSSLRVHNHYARRSRARESSSRGRRRTAGSSRSSSWRPPFFVGSQFHPSSARVRTPASALPSLHGRGDARAPGRRRDGADRRRCRGPHGDHDQGLSRPQRASASFVTRNPPCGARSTVNLIGLTEALTMTGMRRTGHPSGFGDALGLRRCRSSHARTTTVSDLNPNGAAADASPHVYAVPQPAVVPTAAAVPRRTRPAATAERRRLGAHRRRQAVSGDPLAHRRRAREDTINPLLGWMVNAGPGGAY